jgi:hypothetical protein
MPVATISRSDEENRRVEREATILRVWQRMAGKFLARWTSPMGDTPFEPTGMLTPSGAEWLHGLRGLKRAQLWEAMDRLDNAGKGYPPTLPEFRALAWNHPTLDEVDDYLNGRGELTAFSRAMATKLDMWKWRHASADQARRMLEKCYQALCTELQDGRVLAPLDAALEHKKQPRKTAPDHVVHAHLAQIAKHLGMDVPTSQPKETP